MLGFALSFTNSWSLLKLMSVSSVMPSNLLILCHPLLFPPSIFPSIRVLPNESTLRMRWPKYWSFSFSISPSNEHPGLISFRMDWLDLLAVQGTLKSLLQHHSSKASILRHSAFFTVQLSHPYLTTGKTIALTKQTFKFSLFTPYPITGGRAPARIPKSVWPLGSQGAWGHACRARTGHISHPLRWWWPFLLYPGLLGVQRFTELDLNPFC